MVNPANFKYPQSSSSKSRATAEAASASGAGLSEETIQVRKGNRTKKRREVEHSRFLLVEPLLDETEERLWLALEQLRVIFTSEQFIVKFALHQLIVELASLTLGPGEILYQINQQL